MCEYIVKHSQNKIHLFLQYFYHSAQSDSVISSIDCTTCTVFLQNQPSPSGYSF